jgi:CDK inhibitor PHO81
MLPISEEFRTVSFQVDNIEAFTIEFDIYPTFGSKVIARTVALSSIFSATNSSSGQCSLPLFDPRLRPIGQVNFGFQVIKPFRGIPLEIAQFETYWKATSQFDTHPSTLITGSSLSGEYVQIFVQLTSDGTPVLCPRWALELQGIQCVVGRLTLAEFLAFPGGHGRETLAKLGSKTIENLAEIHEMLATSLVTLKDVLATLVLDIHVVIQVLYPSAAEEQSLGLGPSLNINDFADAILRDVFDHARSVRQQKTPDFMRSIVFASQNPDICTALNWKQPNCKSLATYSIGFLRPNKVPNLHCRSRTSLQ